MNQPVPRSVKDIQKFLELANYYKQFIKDFAKVAKLLYKMIRKDVTQNQKEKQQKVFKESKEKFITELVLVTLDLNKEMKVEVDVLDFAIERVLLIKCEDKK